MISIVEQAVVDKYVTYKYVGKSTDVKPTAPNGSKFKEMDTGDEYFFDGDENCWSMKSDVYLSSIEITTPPSTTTYSEGSEFDPTGMVVTAIYNEGSTTPLDDDEYEIVCSSPLTVEDTSVTVVYTENGRKRSVQQEIVVSVNELISIEFSSPPSVYATSLGEYQLDYSLASVLATYTNGHADVTEFCTFDPIDGSLIPEGVVTTVTATYTEGGITKTATCSVEPAPK